MHAHSTKVAKNGKSRSGDTIGIRVPSEEDASRKIAFNVANVSGGREQKECAARAREREAENTRVKEKGMKDERERKREIGSGRQRHTVRKESGDGKQRTRESERERENKRGMRRYSFNWKLECPRDLN